MAAEAQKEAASSKGRNTKSFFIILSIFHTQDANVIILYIFATYTVVGGVRKRASPLKTGKLTCCKMKNDY